jgi:hypothetical protein
MTRCKITILVGTVWRTQRIDYVLNQTGTVFQTVLIVGEDRTQTDYDAGSITITPVPCFQTVYCTVVLF